MIIAISLGLLAIIGIAAAFVTVRLDEEGGEDAPLCRDYSEEDAPEIDMGKAA